MSACTAMLNYFNRDDVSNILGIRTGRLHYWDRIGLAKPSLRKKGKAYYDFQDLICLKTARALVDKGLPAKKIKTSIETLRERIPEFDECLSNKRIYVFGNRVIVSHKNRLIDSRSGQLFFRFDIDEFAEEVDKKVRNFEAAKSADDWFEEGLKYDSNEHTFELAVRAYHAALKLNPNFSDAYVNLGTIHYNRQEFGEAERCFRSALTGNRHHAKAYFNLGNVLDESNRTEEAVECFEKSLEVDSHFPDAHYNLAAAYEQLGLSTQAIQHWKNYLTLDPHSKYAEFARKRVKFLQSAGGLRLET